MYGGEIVHTLSGNIDASLYISTYGAAYRVDMLELYFVYIDTSLYTPIVQHIEMTQLPL